jgi:hypothetical protein
LKRVSANALIYLIENIMSNLQNIDFMNDIWLRNIIEERNFTAFMLAALVTLTFFILFGLSSAYGVELYYDAPFVLLSQDVTVTFLNATAVDTYDPSHLSRLRFTFGLSNMSAMQVINYPISGTINVTSGSNIMFPQDFRITTQARHSIGIVIWLTDKSFSYLGREPNIYGSYDYRSRGPLQLHGSSICCKFDFMENFGEGIHTIKGVAYPVASHSPFGGIIKDQQGHRSQVDEYGYQHRLRFDISFSINVNNSRLPDEDANSTNPLFYKDLGFETGNIDTGWEWGKSQYQTGQRDRLVDVDKNSIQPPSIDPTGVKALKATVHKEDQVEGTHPRAELLLNSRFPGQPQDQKAGYFYEGDDVWYHWYTLFPSGFLLPDGVSTTSPKWQVWTQWHQGDDTLVGGPAVEFNVDGKTKNLDLRVMPWYWNGQECYNVTAGSCGYQWVEPIGGKIGKWIEMLLHVKWSRSDSVGLIDMWVDGNKVVPCNTCSLNLATLDPRDATQSVYMKQGLYLEALDPSQSSQQFIYHDGTKVVKCPSNYQYFHPYTQKCYTTPPYSS